MSACDSQCQKLALQGAEPLGSTPEAEGEYIEKELNRWEMVVKHLALRVSDNTHIAPLAMEHWLRPSSD